MHFRTASFTEKIEPEVKQLMQLKEKKKTTNDKTTDGQSCASYLHE